MAPIGRMGDGHPDTAPPPSRYLPRNVYAGYCRAMTSTQWSPFPTVTLPLQIPVRFRPHGSNDWQDGQLENLTAEGISFLTDLPLEVGELLELALPVAALTSYGLALSAVYARVVKRVLNRWPDDVHTAVAATFVSVPGEM